MTGPELEGRLVKQGRRAIDWVILPIAFALKQASNVFDIWKDDRSHRWSTRRLLLWQWTYLGGYAIYREINARVYITGGQIITPHFLGNAWIYAWAICEGAFIVGVFGPVMIDYYKNAGGVFAPLAGALRDRVIEPVAEVVQRREQAAAAGEPGTEYTR